MSLELVDNNSGLSDIGTEKITKKDILERARVLKRILEGGGLDPDIAPGIRHKFEVERWAQLVRLNPKKIESFSLILPKFRSDGDTKSACNYLHNFPYEPITDSLTGDSISNAPEITRSRELFPFEKGLVLVYKIQDGKPAKMIFEPNKITWGTHLVERDDNTSYEEVDRAIKLAERMYQARPYTLCLNSLRNLANESGGVNLETVDELIRSALLATELLQYDESADGLVKHHKRQQAIFSSAGKVLYPFRHKQLYRISWESCRDNWIRHDLEVQRLKAQ